MRILPWEDMFKDFMSCVDCLHLTPKTRWWFNILNFHPYLGRWSNLTNIFEMGWNHQLEKNAFVPDMLKCLKVRGQGVVKKVSNFRGNIFVWKRPSLTPSFLIQIQQTPRTYPQVPQDTNMKGFPSRWLRIWGMFQVFVGFVFWIIPAPGVSILDYWLLPKFSLRCHDVQ